MPLTVTDKLKILADAAKYDASCASSGTTKRDSRETGGIGSTNGMGICHAYAPDGRCISLLKILMTNVCVYDCRYCINRSSSTVRRARFRPKEVVDLTLNFYKRNYVEGLFLSSGIIRSADYTMEQMVQIVRSLREDHKFRGYIHLKSIPDASPLLIEQAGRYADRLSINIELPQDASISAYAPEKSGPSIRAAMGSIKTNIEAARPSRKDKKQGRKTPPRFAPGGQSTQMIIGADGSTDADILTTSSSLYDGYGLKRVYYSAFSPIPDSSNDLPPVKPPLLREHRLYQADWLLRFYGFKRDEITSTAKDGMLDLDIDPKLAWALQHQALFPLDINKADKAMLLRLPGLGLRGTQKILSARRYRRLRLDDVKTLTRSVSKMLPFMVTADWSPGALTDSADLRARFAPPPEQLDFDL